MIKAITKVGNSNGVIFDATLMDIAHLKTGDQVSITVHESGSIILTPLRGNHTPEEFTSLVRETVEEYGKTLKRLS